MATESSTIQNILKIKTYTSGPNGSFIFNSYGSAIAIGSSRILTNAHVILGANDEPTGLYEICFSSDFEKVPLCRETARLIAYDTVADLAILELSKTTFLVPFSLASSKLAIGSYVSMYWYPRIGGETITRTEWKIAGFERTMYKIDGSIDHGNSGGGAFNNSGELVGIPTAVASDNASIGYMISVKRIQEFLSKKTNNYEIYTHTLSQSFIQFLERNQSYNPNKSSYNWNDISIKNPRPYGFTLKSSMVSVDDTIMIWNFADMYDRVHFSISCTDDAGGILGWQVRKNGFITETKQNPTWNMKMLDDDEYLTIYSSKKDYKSSVVVYYKAYDACFGDIDYLDARKDAKSLEKAIRFLKKWVLFRNKYTLKNIHKNQYFETKKIESDTRIIRSIDELGNESVLLGFEIQPWYWINAVIEGKKYPSLNELWTALGINYDDIKTWNNYFDFAVKNWLDRSKIDVITLGDNQKWLFYASYNIEKKVTNLVFEYTYKTPDGEYAYWTWSTVIDGDQSVDRERIKNIFKWLSYPGQSILLD